MRQPIFPENVPINEKRIAFIERVLMRLSRRSSNQAVTLITPYPISNAVFGKDVKGVVLQYMFPCEGNVSKFFIRLDRYPKKGLPIRIGLFDDSQMESKTFVLSSRKQSMDINLKVKSGDCLDVSIDPLEGEGAFTEVWISLLWTPTINDIEAQSFLIDELEDRAAKLIKDAE